MAAAGRRLCLLSLLAKCQSKAQVGTWEGITPCEGPELQTAQSHLLLAAFGCSSSQHVVRPRIAAGSSAAGRPVAGVPTAPSGAHCPGLGVAGAGRAAAPCPLEADGCMLTASASQNTAASGSASKPFGKGDGHGVAQETHTALLLSLYLVVRTRFA